jgi:hypothetical protein
MHFILHGKAMEDFVDLGGDVDIYVVPKEKGERPPESVFEDMRTNIYSLEGEVASLTAGNAALQKQVKDFREAQAVLHQRLKVAVEEVMRLETRQGIEPPAPAELEHMEEPHGDL